MEELENAIEKIKRLIKKDINPLLLENLIIDMEFLYKKYEKKINPKYKSKIDCDKIVILFYESGINVLLKKDFKEDILWEISKIMLSSKGYSCVKMRKDKDFLNTVMCTSKQLSKLKDWFRSNVMDYEILSLFFVVKEKKEIEERIKTLLNENSFNY
jgi:hypothetical protein